MASPVFVGRQAELTALQLALAQPGRTTTVLVGGEAGAGKSRLVAEFAAAAVGAGARVLTGACVSLGAENLPFAPFVGALSELVAELGPDAFDALVGPARADLGCLVPALRRAGDDHRPAAAADRAVLFQAVLRTLEALGTQAPLVVVVEDVHWTDTSSRELLSFLGGRLRQRVLIVATYRSDEIHRRHPLMPFLAEAARSERVARLELAPLTRTEVAAQLAAIAASKLSPAVVQAVVARAEGNPFFAEELLAAGGGDELPPDLADFLTARLAALPESARELVTVAAVAGRRVGHDLLAAVAGQAGADIGAGLRQATSHHVLVAEAAGSYAFRHTLLQEAAYAELLPAERVSLHGAYAAALAGHPEWATSPAGAAGELAHHYLAAHDPARALEASVAAAAAAEKTYAFAEAHALYEQVLGLWERVPHASALAGCDQSHLLERAADAAMLAGATERAVALVGAALDCLDAGPEPARGAILCERLSRLLWTSGDGEGSLAASRKAVALMPAERSAERARIMAGEARTLMLAGLYQESRARCLEAIRIARAVGAQREEGYALNTLGADLARLGEHEEAVTCLTQALSLAEAAGSIEDVWRAYANLAAALHEAGHLGRAAAVGREGAARLDRLGYEEGAVNLRLSAAANLMDLGEWPDADRLATEALEGAPDDVLAAQGWEVRGLIAARRGLFVSAHAHLENFAGICSGMTDPAFRADPAAARAELALGEGLVDEVRTLVAEGLDALAGSDGQESLLRLVALGLAAEVDATGASVRLSGRRRAEAAPRAHELMGRYRAAMAAVAGGHVPPTRQGRILETLCRAELDRAEGRHDAALWDEAARSWTEFSHPYQAAYARWRQAGAHLATGTRDEAVLALRQAFAEASRLGAAPLVGEIVALARRARARLTAAEPPAPPSRSAGAAGLTNREAEVLALMAAGNTNRQIAEALYMSTKTASVHVSRILSKLGVANRGQAAALAHRLDLADHRPVA